MRVAAISLLCQDERVFESMMMAGTPCPFEGKIGPDALKQWKKYDIERPDYEIYISKLENRSRIDEELAEIEKEEQARIRQEEIQKAIAEGKIIETNIETKEKKVINVHK